MEMNKKDIDKIFNERVEPIINELQSIIEEYDLDTIKVYFSRFDNYVVKGIKKQEIKCKAKRGVRHGFDLFKDNPNKEEISKKKEEIKEQNKYRNGRYIVKDEEDY